MVVDELQKEGIHEIVEFKINNFYSMVITYLGIMSAEGKLRSFFKAI